MNPAKNEATRPVAVVVNDDPTQLAILAGLLRKQKIDARPFERAEDALPAMCAAPPDLIITDVRMPGIDGWRLCRLLRSPEFPCLNPVPILVVSATFAGDEPRQIAVDIGADAFLPAPVDGRKFARIVTDLLRHQAATPPPNVLLVEDSPTLAGLLKNALDSNGYRADIAGTAKQALEAVRARRYDLAVLDYIVPDGKGDQLLDVLRAEQPECMCLMMTGEPNPELALDWMRRGATAYLRKPFSPEYLIELCARARREHALLRSVDLLEARTRALRESEKRGQTILESIPDAVLVHDEAGIILYANTAAALRFEVPGDSLPGRTLHEFVAPERRAAIPDIIAHTKDGNPHFFITEYLSSSGKLIPAEVQECPVPWGGATALLSISRDITKRLKTEQSYKELFTQMQEGFAVHEIICDGDGAPADYRFLAVNPSFERLVGRKAEDLVGRTVLEVLPGTERYWIDTYGRVALTGEPVWFENYSSTTGKIFSVAAFQPEPNRFACIFQDVTAERIAQEEQKKLEHQLYQTQKLESIGRLAGGVAHDFNNMLGVILGHSELALDQLDPAHEAHTDLQEIRRAAERSANLTRQLLAFARKETITPRVLELNEAVSDIHRMLKRLIGESIELEWFPGEGLWPVKVDPSQIDQILANLCVNARDAIAEEGRVVISTENRCVNDADCSGIPDATPGDYVRLTIRDTGCGMDKATLSNLFEPFFTTKAPGMGTGLGLSTVYGIMRQNGGFITVQSEPELGSEFSVYLPRYRGKTQGAAIPEPGRPLEVGKETVLVVEDEPAILDLVGSMLDRLGYQVLKAVTPGEAIAQAERHAGAIDVLLTDVVMPEMNGRTLAKNIQMLYPTIRCVFMSGYTADVIVRHGVLDPGVHFLQKPVSLRVLADMIRKALKEDRG